MLGVPEPADPASYCFERGLVSTNSIRGGRNREVLDRICASTRIFEAWSDEPWVNDGAAVRVSLVGFGNGPATAQVDGKPVAEVYADLTGAEVGNDNGDLTRADALAGNRGACFVGGMKKGQFDIPGEVARQWLALPNPNGKSNATVVLPWSNGLDVTRRPSGSWIVDFGLDMPQDEAALFEQPFAHAKSVVEPARAVVANKLERDRWWLHARPAPDLRRAVASLPRYIATPRVAKFRLFVWMHPPVVIDGQLVATARADDTTFGILHSRFHEL